MSVITLQRTPLQYLPQVSKTLGCAVYVKREDLCHSEHGGNKTRKLALTLADAVWQGATDIITMGAIGSNHVWATAFHAQKLGLAAHAVVLPHAKNPRAEAVCAQTLDCQARIQVAKNDLSLLWRVMQLQRQLKKQGRRPYVIGPGGSSPLSSQAYVAATREVVEQWSEVAWLDASFCALGSGGTLAGIVAGTALHHLPWRVFGVAVRRGLAHSGFWMTRQVRRTLQASASVAPRALPKMEILKSAIGAGYGRASHASQSALALFRDDGIALENTYTAKAAAGLIEQVRLHPEWRSVLLWATAVATPESKIVPEPFASAFLPDAL